jgi:hypothetical protein
MTLDDIKQEFKLTYDKCDPWGSVMQWGFAVAEESYFNRNGDAAMVLDYTPGAGMPDLSENYGHELLEQLSNDDLLQFAILLERFADLCKRKGLDY